ncbi:MAG: hypothetical protein RIR00_912 [Pseudomonadota bacterium]|jgi:hypothetical protein
MADWSAELGEAVCLALRQQAEKLGLSLGDEPVWSGLAFSEALDPYSGEVSRIGVWQGQSRYGKVTLFPDGRVFAEYQVLLPHPQQPGHYVEAVQVWGRPPERLRGDAVLGEYLR